MNLLETARIALPILRITQSGLCQPFDLLGTEHAHDLARYPDDQGGMVLPSGINALAPMRQLLPTLAVEHGRPHSNEASWMLLPSRSS